MSKDSQQQLENIFMECSAKLLVMYKEKQISFSVYRRKSNELEEKFQQFLK
jgi:hypothetical protein